MALHGELWDVPPGTDFPQNPQGRVLHFSKGRSWAQLLLGARGE